MTIAKTLALASTLALIPVIALAQTPKPIKQHNAWGAYSYNDARAGKICYILSIPTEKQPADRDHGDVFFLVSQKPDGSGRFEPQVEVGYPLKANEAVVVNIDGEEFKMFSQGNNAWLSDVKREPDLVAAMRKGRSMKVSGKSARSGVNTSYTYSLSGVTAALGEVTKCEK